VVQEVEMKHVTLSVALAAGALGLSLGTAEAAKGPKKPEIPFTIHVSAGSDDKDVVDSTNDVRRALEKKADWFRLTEDPKEADIQLEIVGRDFSQDKALVVRGFLTTANLRNADIVGQCIPGIFDVTGPWKSAAANMVKRVETFARETYADLAEAQKDRVKARSAANQ
jgi:hypothetical protein